MAKLVLLSKSVCTACFTIHLGVFISSFVRVTIPEIYLVCISQTYKSPLAVMACSIFGTAISSSSFFLGIEGSMSVGSSQRELSVSNT